MIVKNKFKNEIEKKMINLKLKKKRNGKKWRKLKEKIKKLHCSYNSKSSILILGLLV
jgi:hypothetical protein